MMRNYNHLRVLVLGCGSIGMRHLKNLKMLGIDKLVVFDPITKRRERAQQEVDALAVETLDEAFESGVDAVFIGTPNHLHMPNAIRAAQFGCHLFVEKPLAHTEAGINELIDLVYQNQLVTMVGCNMRFHPGPVRVKELIDQGAIGNVHFARVFGGSYLPDWHPWEDYRRGYSANASLGGGCILDGIHEIDLARWYVGEVNSVVGLINKISELEIDVEDVGSIILQHEMGQQSEIHLDYIQRVRVRGCLIAGAEGSIAWEWSDHQVRIYHISQKEWVNDPLPSDWSVNQMYVDETAHFLDCVLSGRNTCNPVSEAAKVTRIALAVKSSSQERRFIDLNLTEL